MFCRQIIGKSLDNARFYATRNSPLAVLRKQTGYSLINCKKALTLHGDDVTKVQNYKINSKLIVIMNVPQTVPLFQAEQWLKEQAQAMGWAKATILDSRATAQGLIGVVTQKNIGAMIEVNCETDFVARNENFLKFVDLASRSCLKYMASLPESDFISRTEFQSESLKNLIGSTDKKLSDELALVIGSVGENASMKRAVCFKVPESIQLIGMTFSPSTTTVADENEVQSGSIGAILGVRAPAELTQELKKNLCLQVMGMNPLKVGDKENDKPVGDGEDEICLIHQEYLFDASKTVGELLDEHQIEVIDYQRYEVGEKIEADENINVATA